MSELSSVTCSYCNRPAHLVDGEKIHGARFKGIPFWHCAPCDAFIGVHPNSNCKPLGRLANRELRKQKQITHESLLILIRFIMQRDNVDFGRARGMAYAWMSKVMRIDRPYCHVNFMNLDQCRIAEITINHFLCQVGVIKSAQNEGDSVNFANRQK